MQRQLFAACGYLGVFLVPTLVVVGAAFASPFLAAGTVMLLFPFGRLVFGDHRACPTLWDERVATALDRLPVVYGIVLFGVVLWLAVRFDEHTRSAVDAIGTWSGLWVMMLFATCPAHELIHRRSKGDARFGRWIAGVAGYPILGHEHLAHHARSGDTEAAEWPRVSESVWQFSGRRLCIVARHAFERDKAARARLGNDRVGGGLIEPALLTLATLTLFTIAGGLPGFLVYLGTIAGVTFGVQVITYLQHWGLGTDNVANAGTQRLAWEDGCRFQAWLTLHLSFHQAHHRSSGTTYYRLDLCPGSPRQPAGYVVLMVLSLIPPLWRRLMLPVLERWKNAPAESASPGRRLSCFTAGGQ